MPKFLDSLQNPAFEINGYGNINIDQLYMTTLRFALNDASQSPGQYILLRAVIPYSQIALELNTDIYLTGKEVAIGTYDKNIWCNFGEKYFHSGEACGKDTSGSTGIYKGTVISLPTINLSSSFYLYIYGSLQSGTGDTGVVYKTLYYSAIKNTWKTWRVTCTPLFPKIS